MLFNSLTFIVFFILTFSVYWCIRSWPARKFVLLIASYLFYAAWNPPFVFLLWISTLIDWKAAAAIEAADRIWRRRLFLLISLGANLGLLGFFKYGNFVLDNFTALLHFAGISYAAPHSDIVLPVGISFYTFQTLSYTMDVYLKRAKPSQSLLDFSLYVSFFPQLVAGPIVRATDFLPQCLTAPKISAKQFGWGLFMITLGLFQKVVLADGLVSKAAETVFNTHEPVHFFDAWTGVLAFSSQIFCDFAGYSTCAIGVALCFGFFLPDNFRFPYAAVGFSDFWHRWHISLSTWLRDYLYIPLGGNRKGRIRMYFNLMGTMLLGGLWHGASWTFVVWGGLHGLYLSAEKVLSRLFSNAAWVKSTAVQISIAVITYLLILLTWIFFRADNFAGAWQLLKSVTGNNPDGIKVLRTLDIIKVLAVTFGINTSHWCLRHSSLETVMEKMPEALTVVLWTAMLTAVILMQGGGNAFIYFQF